MSGSRSRPSPAERAVAALQTAREDPASAASREKIRAALAAPLALVAVKAARIIAENELDGFGPDLEAAFRRFLATPANPDPSCQAKIALLEALDRTESLDPDPFLLAIRCVQPEAAWGPPVDTAGRVRARGILALARLAHHDFGVLAAELLADPDAIVRQTVAEAIEARGDRANAGLLRFKLSVGDEEAAVTLACLAALLTLAPQAALPLAKQYLAGPETQAELAGVALGQSGRDDALDMLVEFLRTAALPSQRALALRWLGYHRSERALGHLLAIIAEAPRKEAAAAVTVLGARSFESGLRARVEEAAGRNERADLVAVIREAFAAESS